MTKQYRAGQFVKVKVTGIQPYGAFVKTKDDVKGLIHISEVMDDFVQNINQYLSKGQIVKAKVIDIDAKGKLNLTLKENEYFKQKCKKRTDRSILDQIKQTEEYGFESIRERLPLWIKEAKVRMYNS